MEKLALSVLATAILAVMTQPTTVAAQVGTAPVISQSYGTGE